VTIEGLPGVLALLFLATAAAFLVLRPQLGPPLVAGVAYLLPFSVPPIEILSLSPSSLDFALFFALAAWWVRLPVFHSLLRLVPAAWLSPASRAAPRRATGGWRLQTGPPGLPLLLFLCAILLSFLLAVDRTAPAQARMFLKLVNSVLLYFTVVNALRETRSLKRTARVLLGCGGVAALAAVALYLAGPSLDYTLRDGLSAIGYPGGESILRQVYGTSVRRAVGTAVDPNLLGGMLALTIPLAAAQLCSWRPLLPRWFLWPGIVFMVAAQVFTYSRGGWLAAGAGILALALLRYPKALIVLAIYLPFLLLPQGEVIVDRANQALEASDPASRLRLNEYQDAIGVITRYPAMGVGFGFPPADVAYVGVSNLYLHIAELTGLAGLALFLWTLVALARFALPNLLATPRPDPLVAGLAAAAVAALTAGLVDHYFFNPQIPHTLALFWLFLGLLVQTAVLQEGTKPQGTPGGFASASEAAVTSAGSPPAPFPGPQRSPGSCR